MAGNDRKSSSKQTQANDGLGNKSALTCKDGTTADSEISGVTSRSLRSHLKLSPMVKEVIKSDVSKNCEKSPKSSPKKRNALKMVKTNKNRVIPYATRSLSSLTILRNGKKKFDLNMLRLKRKQVKKKSTTDDIKADSTQDEKQDSKPLRSSEPTLGTRKLRTRHFSNSEMSSKTNDCSMKAESLESSLSVDDNKDDVMSDDKYSVDTVTPDSVPSDSPITSEIISDVKFCNNGKEKVDKSNANVADISSDNYSSFKVLSELKGDLFEEDNNSTSSSVQVITHKNMDDSSCVVFDLRHCEGFLDPVIVNSKEESRTSKSLLKSEESLSEKLFLSESSISCEKNEPSDCIAELELEGCPAEGGGAILCTENGESSILRCISQFSKVNGSGNLMNVASENEAEPVSPTNDSVSLLTADESVSFEDDLLTIDDSDQALLAGTTSDSESSSRKGFSGNHLETLIRNTAGESNQLTETSLNHVDDKETSFEEKNPPNVNSVAPSLVSSSNDNKDEDKSVNGFGKISAVAISSESSLLEYDEVKRKVDKATDPLEVDIGSDSSADAALSTQALNAGEALNLKISMQTSLADIVRKGLFNLSDTSRSRIEEAASKEDSEKVDLLSRSNSSTVVNEKGDVVEEIDVGGESESEKLLSSTVHPDVNDSNENSDAPDENFINQEIGSKMLPSNIMLQEVCSEIEKDCSLEDSIVEREKEGSRKKIPQETCSKEDTSVNYVIDKENASDKYCACNELLDTSDISRKDDAVNEEILDGEKSPEKTSSQIMLEEACDTNEGVEKSEGSIVNIESCSEELENEVAEQEDTNREDDTIGKTATDELCLSKKAFNKIMHQEVNEEVESIEEMVIDEDGFSEKSFDKMIPQEVNEVENLIKNIVHNEDSFSERPFNEMLQQEPTDANVGVCSIKEMVTNIDVVSEKSGRDNLQQEAITCPKLSEKISISPIQVNSFDKVQEKTSEERALNVSLAAVVTGIQPENNVENSTLESNSLEENCLLQREEINNPSNEVPACPEIVTNIAEDSAEQLAIKETMLNALGLQSSKAASLIKAPVRQGLPPIPSRTSGTLKTIIKVPRMVDKRRARNRVKLVLKKEKPGPEKEMQNTQDQRVFSFEENEGMARDAESMSYDHGTSEDPYAFQMLDECNVSTIGAWNSQLSKQKSKSQGNSRKCMANEPMTQLDLNRMNISRNSIDGIVGSSSAEYQPKFHQDFDPNVASDGSSNSGRSTQQGSSEGIPEPCLVIPEKSSSFSIHPERLCHDVCCYCFGKFGSLDTPMHIAQMKGEDKRRAALTLEPHLSMDSCLCDACYRYLDRKSSCPSYQPYRRQSGMSGGILTKSQVCCVRGCSLPAHHLVRRKWLNRLKRTISKLLPLEITPSPPNQPPSLHAPLCSRHYYCLEFYSVCGICKRKLSRNNMYPVGREVHELNSVLLDDSIPVTLTGKIFLCKMCRYYSGIRLKYRDKKMLSKGHKSFFDGYRKRIWHYLGIQKMDPSEVSAPIEIPKKRKKSKSTEEDSCQEAEQSKHLKLSEDSSKQSGESNSESSSDNSSHKPYHSSLPTKIRFKLGNVSIEHLGNADPGKKGSKTQIAETVTQSSCSYKKPESSKPKKRSSSDSISKQPEYPGVDQLGLNASFLFHGTDDSKEWEKCTTTLQFDAKTKKLWQSLYYPYGNLSSFIRHLVIMERNWRNGDLVLAPNASSQAVNYVNSVQNRIAAYEGSVSRPTPKSTVPKHTVTKESGQIPVPALVPLPPASEILTSVPQSVIKDSVTVLPTTASSRITISNPQCPTNITAPITAQFIPINATTNFLPIAPNQFLSLAGPNSYIHLGSTPRLVQQISNPYSCVQINQESVSEEDMMQKPIETPVIGPTVSSSSSSSSNTFDLHISNVRSLAEDDGNTSWESQSEKQVQSNDDLIINETYDKDKLEEQQINSISVVPITPLAVVNNVPLEISDSNTYLAAVRESNATDINQMSSLFKNL